MIYLTAHPHGGTCTITFGYAGGDRWSHRGHRLHCVGPYVEVKGPLVNGRFPHRKRAEEAIDKEAT